MTRRLPLTLVSLLALALAASPVTAARDERASFDLQAELDQFGQAAPGGAAALTVRDGVMTTAATGVADADGVAMTADTPMWIASTTKTFIDSVTSRSRSQRSSLTQPAPELAAHSAMSHAVSAWSQGSA